jgi:uncharacterized protein YtpQ (UPF0354 family)
MNELKSVRVRRNWWSEALALSVALSACASRNARTAQPSPSQTTPAGSAPAAAAEPIDTSSEAAFTRSVLGIFRRLDPTSSWSSSEVLVLTNDKQWVVNLHRPWTSCRDKKEDCAAVVDHYMAEILKIARRHAAGPASRSQLMAVVRPAGYLQGLPEEVRAQVISEPLVADLLVLYVVDEGGAARGAKMEDLSASGTNREALSALARENLAGLLPPLVKCERDSVVVLAAQNYYESSRLLLGGQWADLAAKAGGSLVVAAPGNDVLVIACNPSRTVLGKLPAVALKLWQSADRPLSPSLFEWTGNGWRLIDPAKNP